MADFIRSDLEFILQQILIAEQNTAGADLRSLLPNDEVPWGLRTVDGTLNNLVPTQSEFGATDNTFPRLIDPVFGSVEPVAIDPDGPGGQAVGNPTSYAQTSGAVFNSQPRVISILLVDQTPNNPAVAATAQNPGAVLTTSLGLDSIFGTADDTPGFFIPNLTPDVGLSAPFNMWMTFFGQFFNHGLALVTKGGAGTIFVPLQPDDSLFVLGGHTNFMVETRTTVVPGPGPDGILGTLDDTRENENSTTPLVDQSQTYASHPSHQVFLREYS